VDELGNEQINYASDFEKMELEPQTTSGIWENEWHY
jgi:hypothetical protein